MGLGVDYYFPHGDQWQCCPFSLTWGSMGWIIIFLMGIIGSAVHFRYHGTWGGLLFSSWGSMAVLSIFVNMGFYGVDYYFPHGNHWECCPFSLSWDLGWIIIFLMGINGSAVHFR